MKIVGVVETEALASDNEAKYKVDSDGISYEIVSTDKQAVKDLIFLRKGQKIEVDATVVNNNYVSKGAIIDIASIYEKQEF